MSRSRGFAVTDFELDEKFWNEYEAKCEYIIRGQETCPKTGKMHWQIYLYLKNARTIKSMLKDLSPRHVEIAKGTPKQNTDYCSKEGIVKTFGKLPQQGERVDLKKIQTMIEEGCTEVEIAKIDFSKWCQYGKRFEAYRQLITKPRNWVTKVFVAYGEPGTGKTRYVHEKHPDVCSISLSGDEREPFVLGYKGEKVVLFDEYKPREGHLEWMLRALDRYPMKVNIKGGYIEWAPETVYFTTNDNPETWWGGNEAFKRRATFLKF